MLEKNATGDENLQDYCVVSGTRIAYPPAKFGRYRAST